MKINMNEIAGGFPIQVWLSLGEDSKHAFNTQMITRIELMSTDSGATYLDLHFSDGSTLSLTEDESKKFAQLMSQSAKEISFARAQANAMAQGGTIVPNIRRSVR